MNTEQKYIQGFNSGYVLAKHEPNLLNTISKNLNLNCNYLQGIFAGKEEFELEKSKDQLFEIGKLRSQSFTNNNDRMIE